MQDLRSLEILLHGLRAALLDMQPGDPNRKSLEQALRYTERSSACASATERATLLRVAAAHLRHANVANEDTAENELLAAVRRAMTVVLFEHISSPPEELLPDDRCFESFTSASESHASDGAPAPVTRPQ